MTGEEEEGREEGEREEGVSYFTVILLLTPPSYILLWHLKNQMVEAEESKL